MSFDFDYFYQSTLLSVDKEEGSSLLALLTDELLAFDGSVKEEGVNF